LEDPEGGAGFKLVFLKGGFQVSPSFGPVGRMAKKNFNVFGDLGGKGVWDAQTLVLQWGKYHVTRKASADSSFRQTNLEDRAHD
jgi:hypothetical protein